MSNKDRRGYYKILGVTPKATTSEIKTAYRRKAMELHPDRNAASTATSEFQLLNEAYGVLCQPNLRAKYDETSIEDTPKARSQNSSTAQSSADPITCSCCGLITAQPRFVIFRIVKSFILITNQSYLQGIFCSDCAEKKAIQASSITLILGWWALPWGPLYSIQALFINMMGGQQNINVNAKLATHQAWYFAAIGNKAMSRAIALDALALSKKNYD